MMPSERQIMRKPNVLTTYQQLQQPLDQQNRQPWSGQQHVEPSRCDSMYDIENDDAHSGFKGNQPFKAPKFIAGLSAMPDDEM